MNTTTRRGQNNLKVLLQRLPLSRGLVFGVIIIVALFAFEVFNYSTTQFALSDLLGDLKFASLGWATILAIAFCGIDFAGIARLFIPQEGVDEPTEVWYLFGAWLLAATMNAMLTWWAVSIAIISHKTQSSLLLSQEMLTKVVPMFVAIMVWLIRVLIIGTLSVAGDRLFSQAKTYTRSEHFDATKAVRIPGARPTAFKPVPKLVSQPTTAHTQPEPTYHPVGVSVLPNGKRCVLRHHPK